MKMHPRRGLFVLALLTLTGCGDTAETIMRTGVNYKSELTDRLMKVKDEDSAKSFIEDYLKAYTEKTRDLDEKWKKFLKDIEDDLKGKKVLVVAGDPQAAAEEKDARIVPTRDAFTAYVKNIGADQSRFDREKARIKGLVNYLVAEKTSEEKAKGVKQPVINAGDLWPNLVKINDPNTFQNLTLSGAKKEQKAMMMPP